MAAVRAGGQCAEQQQRQLWPLFRDRRHDVPAQSGADRCAHPDPEPAHHFPVGRKTEAVTFGLSEARACGYSLPVMLRLTDIKLPLGHAPEALKAAILKKLKLPAEALLEWHVFKRAHDARNRNAI